MRILDELLSTLDLAAEVRDVRIGLFFSAVWTRALGLAANLPRDALRQHSPLLRQPGSLLERSAAELAEMVRSTSLVEAAVGMATINSLLEVDESQCVERNAADLIAEKGRGRRVAIVGHFPFVPRLREQVQELYVIEKNPRPGDYGEERAADLIPQADVVGITGASFVNHTFEAVCGLCLPSAFVVVLGGTTPLTPLLFDHGVDAISGTRVADPELALRCVSQGAGFRKIAGRRLLTMVK